MNYYDYARKCKRWTGLERVLYKVFGGFLLPLSGTRPEERLEFLTMKRLSAEDLVTSFQLMDCGKEYRIEMWTYHTRSFLFGWIMIRRLIRIARFRSQKERFGDIGPALMSAEWCRELASTLDRRGLTDRVEHIFEVHHWGPKASVRMLEFPKGGIREAIGTYLCEVNPINNS